MKHRILINCLAFGLNLGLLGACTTGTDQKTVKEETPKEKISEGWENTKEGTSEMASGVADATKNAANDVATGAKEVGHDIAEGAKEAGHDVKASACPVVANKQTRLFYTKADKRYESMLAGEKVLAADQRECFMSEQAALADGFKKAR